MRGLDKFNAKMRMGGNSLREEHIYNSRMLMGDTFFDDASLTPGVYFWQHGKRYAKDYVGDDGIAIRIFKRSFSAAQGVTMKFQTLYDTQVMVGDLLYDSHADEHYICTESFDMDGVHWQGKLTMCNWILKWQDADGVIWEYPCYDVNTTQYNSGEQSNRQFTIGSSQHMLTLPCDENTVKLKTPKRIFLDKNMESPSVFIVTQNDTTSYGYGKKGIVRVTVTENVFNHDTDRIDLGICDYFEPLGEQDDVVESDVMRSVIEHDSDVIKSGGDAKRFTAVFYDENGTVLPHIKPRWNIISSFRDALDVEIVDNDILIGIDDDAYIDEDFKLVLSDDRSQCVSSIVITVESLL